MRVVFGNFLPEDRRSKGAGHFRTGCMQPSMPLRAPERAVEAAKRVLGYPDTAKA